MAENAALITARTLYKDNKKQEARTLLANAIIADPNDADLWFGLAFCLDDKDQIIYSLNRVLQINPSHPKAVLELHKRTDISPNKQIPTPIEPLQPDVERPHMTSPISIIPGNEAAQNTDNYFLKVVVKGEAGESTAEIGMKWRRFGIIVVTIILLPMAIFNIMLFFPNRFHINPIITLIVMLIILSGYFWINWIIDPIIKKMQKYRQGARAEVRVGETLKTLGPNYIIINDVQTGRGNIDHLVLSKTGQVFVIETKSHFGRLEISKDELFHNGYKTEKDFIKQVLGNTFWVKEKLMSLGITASWITPILVFTNLWVPENPPVKGVYIKNVKYLNRQILDIARTDRKNQVWEKRAEIVRAMGK